MIGDRTQRCFRLIYSDKSCLPCGSHSYITSRLQLALTSGNSKLSSEWANIVHSKATPNYFYQQKQLRFFSNSLTEHCTTRVAISVKKLSSNSLKFLNDSLCAKITKVIAKTGRDSRALIKTQKTMTPVSLEARRQAPPLKCMHPP